MSSGFPAICFNSIPYEDIGIPNKDLIVAQINSEESLQNCIQSLINSKELRDKIGQSAMDINIRLNNNVICGKFANLIEYS